MNGSARAQLGSGDRVLVATTGNDSELVKTVPIARHPAKKPRVVMSMGPHYLPSFANGDKLQVTAELEVTTDCVERIPRCVGKPYAYNPIVDTRILLANGQLVAGGAGTLQLGAQRRRCRQNPPARVHHCVIVFTDIRLDVTDRSQLPCAPGSCYLNLVVDAHNKRKEMGKKGRRNKLLIGQDEPDGSVKGDMGRLNAIRFSPDDQPPVPPLATGTPLTASVPIRKGEDVVVFSQELSGLEKGDQLAVQAWMTTSIGHLPYNVKIRSRLILAPDPTATQPGRYIKNRTEPRGEIAEANGFNCTRRRPLCPTNKVGAITMLEDAANRAGEPVPMYANLLVDTARPGSAVQAGHVVQLVSGGLAVTVYPDSLRG
jgi:hypothetical protein